MTLFVPSPGSLFGGGWRPRVRIELVFDLLANDRKVVGRLDANPDDSLRNANDGHRDILADPNLLANFSREYEHRAFPKRRVQKTTMKDSNAGTT
jgi:hypothetical protein